MWIFTRYGFYSVAVKDKRQVQNHAPCTSRKLKVEVRARLRLHLANLQVRFRPVLKDYRITVSPHNDYRFRMVLPMHVWEGIVSAMVQEQTWGNFKDEAKRFGKAGVTYVEALHAVWWEMHQLQGAGRFAPSRGDYFDAL